MTIIEELRQNRESGAKRLEAEYKAGLMTLARRFCSDESEAAELVNRTFAAVVDGIDNYLEQSAFFGWMCQILSNIHAKDHRNKSNGIVVYPGEVPDMADEAAEDAVFRNIDRSLLREAVNGLPEDQRESVVLHYFLDIPIPKIAKILAVPGGTVKSRLHYARKALAVKLGVAVRKPGAKALLAVIALCAITAAGAAVVAAWNAATTDNAECRMQNAECEDTTSGRSTPPGLFETAPLQEGGGGETASILISPLREGGGGETAGGSTAWQATSPLQPSNRQTVKPSNQQENTMKTTPLLAATVAAAASLTAVANPPWSDTPVTCHWIGAVKAGTTTGGDYASWTNQDNWAEGIVPGMSIVNGVTNGCAGCTAVFDRNCTYSAVDFLWNATLAISNIVVTGPNVPKITFGRPWEWRNPYLYLERGGGVYVSGDVAEAPEVHASIYYLRGASGPTTTLRFENDSAGEMALSGFQGPDVAFSSFGGTMTLAMRGAGDIRQSSSHTISLYSLMVKLGMAGGKYIQGCNASVDQISTVDGGVGQHLEIASGKTLNIRNGTPVLADSDLLIDGEGTCNFNAAASSPAILAVATGKTLTLDCDITRTSGGKFQIGWWGPRNGGTVALAPGRSFNAPVEFFGGTLKLSGGETFSGAITIASNGKGAILGSGEGESKLTGGVAGTTRPLTLKGAVAIASDITAETTFAADSNIAFRRAGDAATSFSLSSVKLADNTSIPVDSGVTATIASINNNGFALDIRPKGTGKVKFTSLTPGLAPSWLTYKGGKGRIEADGTLTGTEATFIFVR